MKRFNKNIWINPSFQKKFLFFCTGAFAISCLIFYAASNYFFNELREIGMQMNLPPGHIFFKFVGKQSSNFDLIFFSGAGLLFTIQITIGLLFSHRISGPIHRFTKTLNQLNELNELKPISSRENDYFPEVFESYNKVVKIVKDSSSNENNNSAEKINKAS